MTVFPGRLRAALDTLRGSYWLIPALMGLAAVVLAVTTGGIDRWLLPDLSRRWGRWISTAGPDGARAVLTTIAASMMTLASLTYSLTLVALTLAAGQYGPRLLRTFMRDRVTQVGLGAFLSTFVFCLAALRSVGASDDRASVPHVSVAVGMFMGALCLAYLVYFIHHVASSINATSVISAVSQELMTSIEAYGDRAGGPDERPPTPAPPEALRVPSPATGYVTLTDLPAMVKASEASDGHAWLVVRPGDFVVEGEPLALVVGIEDARTVVPQAIVIGPERTMLQDTEFGVAQLVEVALRALSPGINDPFTAMACVDRLGAALVALASYPPAAQVWCGRSGVSRVVRLRVATFDGTLRAAFDPLRQAARGHVAVLIRLAEALGRIGRAARRDDQRDGIRRQLEMIAAGAVDVVPEPRDRDDVLASVDASLAALSPRSSTA
jgi:uncharacterized membrane protein